MPAQTRGRVQKYLQRRKYKKAEVLRILAAVMEKQATGAEGEKSSDYHNEFFNTGRIGRRNALPDILSYNCATTTTADLPARLSALTTKDTQLITTQAPTGSSIIDRNEPSTSQSCANNTQAAVDKDMTTT